MAAKKRIGKQAKKTASERGEKPAKKPAAGTAARGGADRILPSPAKRPINSLHLHPSGNFFAVGHSIGKAGSPTLALADADTGKVRAVLEKTEDFDGAVHRVRFSPDGKSLAYVHQKGSSYLLKIHDLGSGATRIVATSPDFSMHRGLGFDASGSLLAVPGRIARVLDPASGKPVLEVEVEVADGADTGRNPEVDPAAGMSNDGRILAVSGGAPGTISLREIPSGRVIAELRMDAEAAMGLTFDATGTYFAAVDFFERRTFLWRLRDREPIAPGIFADANPAAGCLAFSPDGKRLAMGLSTGFAILADAESGERLLSEAFHKRRINDIGFSADGGLLYTGGHGDGIHIRTL